MDDYTKQLEKRVEELEELLAMSEEDALAYKFLLPVWKTANGHNGTEHYYAMPLLNSSNDSPFKTVFATVKCCPGGTDIPDKPWFFRMHVIEKNQMPFFATEELAKQEVERIYMNYIRSNA